MSHSVELLGPLLQQVSRSFYLTLRVLPEAVRPQISLAYLLARASDTIADTEVVPREERIAILREFSEGRASARPFAGRIGAADATPSEVKLLECLPAVMDSLAAFSPDDQQRIRDLLQTIISGQIFDLERFTGAKVTALANDAETDRYTYLVAGCVGEFWTKMCRAHLPGMERLGVEQGIRFGKGLQLVNILRDLRKDLRIGRCYLPVDAPARLLAVENFREIEPVYAKWLRMAGEHLDVGWEYTLCIPANQKRLRLACIWPLWIGARTLAGLRQANPLDAAQHVKVSRWQVYAIMAESALLVGNDSTLDEAYRRLRSR